MPNRLLIDITIKITNLKNYLKRKRQSTYSLLIIIGKPFTGLRIEDPKGR
jgi:hypothetical protein